MVTFLRTLFMPITHLYGFVVTRIFVDGSSLCDKILARNDVAKSKRRLSFIAIIAFQVRKNGYNFNLQIRTQRE